MKSIDKNLFDQWEGCSREAGNEFLEYFYSRHVHTRYSSSYEEGRIPQLIAKLGRDFYSFDNPIIDDLLKVFYKNFENIQRKVKAGEITDAELVSSFEYNLLCRISDYFHIQSKKKEEQDEKKRPKIISLDEEMTLGWEGDTIFRIDTIPDTEAETPEDLAAEAEQSERVERLLEEFQQSLARQRKKLLEGLRRLKQTEGHRQISTEEAAQILGFTGRDRVYNINWWIRKDLSEFIAKNNLKEEPEVEIALRREVNEILDL